MNPLYDFDDIDDYLHERMSASDRAAFEQALQSDEELQRRVEAQRAESQVLRLLRDAQLLEQFESWEQELDEKKTTPGEPPGRRRLLLIGALIALLGLLFVAYWRGWLNRTDPAPAPPEEQQRQDTLPQQDTVAVPPVIPPEKTSGSRPIQYAALRKENFIEKDFKGALMGADTPDVPETPYAKAVQLYEAKQYAAALQLLERPDSSQLNQYRYLRAYTLYQLGRYAEAEREFRTFRDLRRSPVKIDAQWGEVFSLLGQLPAEAAQKRLDAVLQEMSDPAHPYYAKAKALRLRLAGRE